MTFKVDRTPGVSQQMRELAKRAKARRIHDAYGDALRRMLHHLQDHPLEWGDPESHTKHPGGLFCHGIAWPLFVRFAVYQAEQTVVIFDIKPLPSSPLADA
jgi:hypothetical protein